MTDDEKFFERLRGDAASLRYQADEATLARIRARIQEKVAPKPTIAELLVAWFRPLAAGMAAIALVAAIGLTIDRTDATISDADVEIVMGGDTYLVGD